MHKSIALFSEWIIHITIIYQKVLTYRTEVSKSGGGSGLEWLAPVRKTTHEIAPIEAILWFCQSNRLVQVAVRKKRQELTKIRQCECSEVQDCSPILTHSWTSLRSYWHIIVNSSLFSDGDLNKSTRVWKPSKNPYDHAEIFRNIKYLESWHPDRRIWQKGFQVSVQC